MRRNRVSRNGRVTIPSEYRKELNILPGDYLEWTLSKDGKLNAKILRRDGTFLPKKAINDPIDNKSNSWNELRTLFVELFCQQFYSASDFIDGRTSKQNIEVIGTERVMWRLVKQAEPWITSWEEGNYDEFMRSFAETLEIDYPRAKAQIAEKITALGVSLDDSSTIDQLEVDMNRIVFSVILGNLIQSFRADVLNEFHSLFLKFIYEKAGASQEEVLDLISDYLYEEHSVILNLYVLRRLSELLREEIDLFAWSTAIQRFEDLVLSKSKNL
ncbi:MAG: AbrB/MazE/SpoVT family DNA-binding domain-containing protein [Candidatus Kariarchaeaceae archaeon]